MAYAGVVTTLSAAAVAPGILELTPRPVAATPMSTGETCQQTARATTDQAEVQNFARHCIAWHHMIIDSSEDNVPQATMQREKQSAGKIAVVTLVIEN
jgi:hypothetical protein